MIRRYESPGGTATLSPCCAATTNVASPPPSAVADDAGLQHPHLGPAEEVVDRGPHVTGPRSIGRVDVGDRPCPSRCARRYRGKRWPATNP